MTEKNLISETEYAAFISYRHVDKDREWAEWLIHALETYRVPKHLQKLGYPQRIGKVFRDEDELPLSSDLTDQIKQALTLSRNLIVICSPETLQSKWIAREIEMFQEQGKANRIHAFLIEGEPQTAFPDGLRFHRKNVTAADGTVTTIVEEREPLAANVVPISGVSKKQRDKAALLKLVAAIIGCSYDDLVQRDKAREQKKQNILRTIFASILLLVSLGGFYWWDYTRLKIDYYEVDFDKLYQPGEIQDLTLEQLKQKIESFPCCTFSKKGQLIGDPVNLVVVGDGEEALSAFIRSGWRETGRVRPAPSPICRQPSVPASCAHPCGNRAPPHRTLRRRESPGKCRETHRR